MSLLLNYCSFYCSKELQDQLGNLFVACETPEPPKQGFFKELFGGGVSQLDREELCKFFSICDKICISTKILVK